MKLLSRGLGLVLGLVLTGGLLIVAAPPALAQRIVTLTIVTVPHLPAARFSFDGQRVTSDSKGVVRLYVPASRSPHKLQLLTPTIRSGGTQAQFVRWWGQPNHDQDYKTNLTGLSVDRSERLQVAFRVSYLVKYRMVNQNHQPVDSRRIEQVVIKSDTGELINVHGGQARLTGYRPALQSGTMAEKQAVYSLWTITINGSDAIHAGQMRFLPSLPRDQNLEFVIPLKSIQITASDRLLGRSVGKAVVLTFPDHTSTTIPFGRSHTITINNLVRGNYQVRLVGSSGFGGNRSLSLSRNQNIVLRVWNFEDFALVLLVLIIIVTSSLVGGRLGRPRRARRKNAKESVP